MTRYVIYKRVSTKSQGDSGLGIEAQERDIDIFLTQYSEVPYEVLGVFKDIQSGMDDERPELAKALRLAKASKAQLLVAKLDRLSRKVSTIAAIMDDVKVRVAAMPNADNFQLHIYAALAEQERDFISKRTIAALGAAKARGVKLGGLRDKTGERNKAVQAKAAAEAAQMMLTIAPLRTSGMNLSQIADRLNDTGIRTSRGGQWTATQVKRVLDRVDA